MATILIVDDVPAMAEQYAYDLRRLGAHDVAVATGGDEGLEILTRESIDCVILDLEMPGKDGFAVLRAMRERPELGEKLLEVAGGEVANMQDLSILLCRKTAMERIACFLMTMAGKSAGPLPGRG